MRPKGPSHARTRPALPDRPPGLQRRPDEATHPGGRGMRVPQPSTSRGPSPTARPSRSPMAPRGPTGHAPAPCCAACTARIARPSSRLARLHVPEPAGPGRVQKGGLFQPVLCNWGPPARPSHCSPWEPSRCAWRLALRAVVSSYNGVGRFTTEPGAARPSQSPRSVSRSNSVPACRSAAPYAVLFLLPLCLFNPARGKGLLLLALACMTGPSARDWSACWIRGVAVCACHA